MTTTTTILLLPLIWFNDSSQPADSRLPPPYYCFCFVFCLFFCNNSCNQVNHKARGQELPKRREVNNRDYPPVYQVGKVSHWNAFTRRRWIAFLGSSSSSKSIHMKSRSTAHRRTTVPLRLESKCSTRMPGNGWGIQGPAAGTAVIATKAAGPAVIATRSETKLKENARSS